MEIIERPIDSVIPSKDNPREIDSTGFEMLKQSIKDLPQMLKELRPVVINQSNEIIGGNMRYRACKELGWETIPTIQVDWSTEAQREFMLRDNIHFGEWDMDVLKNWDNSKLQKWGMQEFTDTDIIDEEPAWSEEEEPEDLEIEIMCPNCMEVNTYHESELKKVTE